MEINYKTYTRDELLEAKASLDREKEPENYENLIGEISKRGEGLKNKLTPREISAVSKLKILGWLRIAAAFVIVFFVVSAAFSQFGIFDLLVGLIAIGLNGLAGWYLLSCIVGRNKNRKENITLTKACSRINKSLRAVLGDGPGLLA